MGMRYLVGKWTYLDSQGQVQGPFTSMEMSDWCKAGFFAPDLPVKQAQDADFEPLGQLIRRMGNVRDPFLVFVALENVQTTKMPPEAYKQAEDPALVARCGGAGSDISGSGADRIPDSGIPNFGSRPASPASSFGSIGSSASGLSHPPRVSHRSRKMVKMRFSELVSKESNTEGQSARSPSGPDTGRTTNASVLEWARSGLESLRPNPQGEYSTVRPLQCKKCDEMCTWQTLLDHHVYSCQNCSHDEGNADLFHRLAN